MQAITNQINNFVNWVQQDPVRCSKAKLITALAAIAIGGLLILTGVLLLPSGAGVPLIIAGSNIMFFVLVGPLPSIAIDWPGPPPLVGAGNNNLAPA